METTDMKKKNGKCQTHLKVAVAAVWPEPQSAAAAESAAFPVVGTNTERRRLLLQQFHVFICRAHQVF